MSFIKTILVPFDFSETAQLALENAATISSKLNAKIILLNVNKINDLLDLFLSELAINKQKTIISFILNKMQLLANEISKKYNCEIECKAINGHVASCINDVSDEINAQLIIMGTKGKDSKSDLFLGSNAYRVITLANVPVLTVSPNTQNKTITSILLIVNQSKGLKALFNYTFELAKALNCSITLLLSENEIDVKSKTILSQINSLKAASKKENILLQFCIEKSVLTVQKALSTSNKHKIDLIICSANKRSQTVKPLLNNFNHVLVHQSPIPVITVKK
ncbi:MAG: universal stress protein [Bacteroidetes bacterium]|nr:universal stress protein [Bacteroidota bacterium]